MSDVDSVDAQNEKLVFFPQLGAVYQIPGSTDALRAQEKRGEFPPRRRIGPRRVAWLESEILTYKANLPTAQSKPVVRKARPTWMPPPKKMGRPTNAERAAREAVKAAAEGKAAAEDEPVPAAVGGGS